MGTGPKTRSPKRKTKKQSANGTAGLLNISPNKKMTIVALVTSDKPNEYTGKKGLVKDQVLGLLDQEPGENRCGTMMEYALSETEKAQYAGKLLDKRIKFAITEILPIGGRVKLRGKILEVLK